MTKCDNWSIAHSTVITGEDYSAIRATCTTCNESVRIGKDINGNPEHRQYSEWFKKDLLQHGYPLFYKYHPEGMRVV